MDLKSTPQDRAVAVAQLLPGIGDMIWHLPHIRAIAAHVGHPVTLIAKPRSRADQIFSAEHTICDVVWLDRNPKGRRGHHDGSIGFLRAVATLRARRFDAIYLLHRSRSLALMAMMAGIPARFGYGYGIQGWFLNRPPRLPNSMSGLHPFDRATEWLLAAGIPMTEAEPFLPVMPCALATVRARIATVPVAIGIGSSERRKQWGAARFAALADGLTERGIAHCVLVGGLAEASLAAEIRSLVRRATITSAITWSLPEIAALLSLSAFFVGNDSGFLNMAAAVGARAYGLYGSTSPFHRASRMVAVTPPGGISKSDGMDRIAVEQVLATISGRETAASREEARSDSLISRAPTQ
jgi:heptosyltransferase-2